MSGGAIGLQAAARITRPTAMSTLATVSIIAGAQVLGILLTPGPERGTFDDTFVNAASEGAAIPYIAGRVRTVPNLTWYGDLGSERVRNGLAIGEMILEAGLEGFGGYLAGGGHFGGPVPDPPTAMLGALEGTAAGMIVAGVSALRTFSWKYFTGRAYTICHGRINAVTKVYEDETVLATGTSANVDGSLLIDKRNQWGGDHKEGGFYAMCDIVGGSTWPTQLPNPYLASYLGNVPAFSGRAMFIIRGPSGYEAGDQKSGYFFAGVEGQPALKPFSLEVERYPDLLGQTAYTIINSYDANPVEVIYDILTARTRGFGYGGKVPLEKIDIASFQAAAHTVYTEGLGYTVEITDNINLKQWLEDLCAFTGCFIYEHPVTGLVTIKLVRADYDISTLPVFDESNIESVSGYNPGTYAEVPNELRFTYIDRDNNYKERPVIAQNDAAVRLAGQVLPKSIDYPGIYNKIPAGIITARELAAAFPRPPLKLIVDSDGDDIQIGDPIVWRYPKYRVAQMVLRVAGIRRSDTASNKVELTCAMDVFGRGNVIVAYPSDTLWTHERFSFNWGDFEIPMLQFAGQGDNDWIHGEAGNFAIPMFAFAGSGNVIAGGAGDFDIPMFAFSGAGTVQTLGGGDFDIPMFAFNGAGSVISDAILMEIGSYILGEDGSKILDE